VDSPYFLSYLAVVIVTLGATVIGCAMLLMNKIFGQRPREVAPSKGDIYECGVPFQGDAREQFSVRYYLVAIIFLLFDVEVVLMYPWALVYKDYLLSGPVIIFQMAIFAATLLVGYLYLRLRGAFNWD